MDVKNNSLFYGLSDIEFEKSLNLFNAKSVFYDKGDMIKSSGEVLKYFGVVKSGSVNVCIDDIDGNRTIMSTVESSNSFGEALCIMEDRSPVYIYANEKSEVLWLDAKKLYTEPFDTTKLNLQKKFTLLLAKRTLEKNNRIQILSKLSIREKIIAYLSALSKVQNSKTVTVPINREDMAIYIGANRTALSRELAKMKDEKIIDYYKNTFRLR